MFRMLVLRDGSLNEPGFSSGPLGKRGRGLLWPSYIFTSERNSISKTIEFWSHGFASLLSSLEAILDLLVSACRTGHQCPGAARTARHRPARGRCGTFPSGLPTLSIFGGPIFVARITTVAEPYPKSRSTLYHGVHARVQDEKIQLNATLLDVSPNPDKAQIDIDAFSCLFRT